MNDPIEADLWPFRYRHHGQRVGIKDPHTRPNPLYDHSIILYYQNLESGGDEA